MSRFLIKCIESANIKCFHTKTRINSSLPKTLKKVMGSSFQKKKLRFVDSPILPSPSALSKGAYEGKKSVNTRRIAMLNKMFMHYITDLMATGEHCQQFLGYGLEINRVQVTPDFKGLNVFWIGKGNENDEILTHVLKKNSGFLKHELSQLRVMGEIPSIHFIKDKHYAHIMELDNRLAVADFGEDHTPIDNIIKLKSELELFTPLDECTKEQITKLEEILGDPVSNNANIPPMPQNIFGLNHSQILNRIQKLMKKGEAIHRISSSNNSIIEDYAKKEPSADQFVYANNKAQREEFKKFLQNQRQILARKNNKSNRNYSPDIEYIENQKEEESRFFDDMNKFDFEDFLDDEGER